VSCLEPAWRTQFHKLLFQREWPHSCAFDVLSIDGECLTDRVEHGFDLVVPGRARRS
jgi:hypothetical protein